MIINKIISFSLDPTYMELELPGFRFHPTEEELLDFYLQKMVTGKNVHNIIGYLNLYRYDPWVLPGLSKIGEREWYFFVPRDRKNGSGGRPNRCTENGFWKATGSDRKIFSLSDPKKLLGLKKTLVFYQGRAPRGSKTDWIMNEYRLPDTYPLAKEIVLCKIYRKATSMKVLEERAAMEQDLNTLQVTPPLSSEETISFDTKSDPFPATPMESCHVASDQDPLHFIPMKLEKDCLPPLETPTQSSDVASDDLCKTLLFTFDEKLKEEPDANNSENYCTTNKVSSLRLPTGEGVMKELQLPKMTTDWTQDSFWTQLCSSPWMDNIMLASPYANILNF